jgi:hypothetical protein
VLAITLRVMHVGISLNQNKWVILGQELTENNLREYRIRAQLCGFLIAFCVITSYVFLLDTLYIPPSTYDFNKNYGSQNLWGKVDEYFIL